VTAVNGSDSLHRLIKLALDTGEAASLTEAEAIFSKYRLRIHVDASVAKSGAWQHAVLTLLNAGSKAFLGGVFLSGDSEFEITVPGFESQTLRQVASDHGVKSYSSIADDLPTIVVGDGPCPVAGAFAIRLASDGWRCGLLPAGVSNTVSKRTFSIGAIVSAALALNEAFLYVRGETPAAGHREIGLSLWEPTEPHRWQLDAVDGPDIVNLPKALWLVGLGHLGQAFGWIVAGLPYAQPSEALVVLQDMDSITEASLSTGMMASAGSVGRPKTRVVSDWLEKRGFKTRIVERFFDAIQRVRADEPQLGLIGLDNAGGRRAIDVSGFAHVIEAGLGNSYRDFRAVRVHAFPGPKFAIDLWAANELAISGRENAPAYKNMLAAGADQCGVVTMANKSVGTPFVGLFAAGLVIAEVLRLLNSGPRYSVVDVTLKNLSSLVAVKNTCASTINPGYLRVSGQSTA